MLFFPPTMELTEPGAMGMDSLLLNGALMPKPSISTAVRRVGTAYGEIPYAAASVMAMWVLVDPLSGTEHAYCEGQTGKSRIAAP